MIHLGTKSAAALGVTVLLATYALHSRDDARVHRLLARKTMLRKPLRQLPLVSGDWIGSDVPVDEKVVKVLAADDFVKRRYRHVRTGEVLELFISFYGSRRSLVGHHPERCYTAFGWERLKPSRKVEMGSPGEGKKWPAEVFWYKQGQAKTTAIISYIASGKATSDRDVVRKLSHQWLHDGNVNYLMQIQISLTGDRELGHLLRPVGDLFEALRQSLNGHLPSAPPSKAQAGQE